MADLRPKRIAELIEPLRVTPGRRVTLEKHFDPGYKAGFLNKEQGTELLAQGVELLSEYQERLAAQDTHGVVVVLQALDAAGKDGTIRHVMSGVNPQGVSVHSYKAPSPLELDHDYLWRFASSLPRRGEIGIFNRSYYEEVLVVRVHPEILQNQQLPRQARGRDVWRKRYRDINDWERYLTDKGFTIVKLLPEPLEGGAAHPLPQAHRPARPQLEVLGGGRQGARLLGRLPEGVLRDALGHQHRVGTLVRHPSRPQVVRTHLRAAVIANALIKIDPRFPRVAPEAHDALMETKGLLEAEAPEGAEADPFEAEELETAKTDGKSGKKGKKKGSNKAKKSK